jgi:hypothetical protein
MMTRDDDDDDCPDDRDPHHVDVLKAVAIAGLSALACAVAEWAVDEVKGWLRPDRTKGKKDD